MANASSQLLQRLLLNRTHLQDDGRLWLLDCSPFHCRNVPKLLWKSLIALYILSDAQKSVLPVPQSHKDPANAKWRRGNTRSQTRIFHEVELCRWQCYFWSREQVECDFQVEGSDYFEWGTPIVATTVLQRMVSLLERQTRKSTVVRIIFDAR